jgi:hypothetical protein
VQIEPTQFAERLVSSMPDAIVYADAGVPDDEQAKIAGGSTARVYNFDVARLTDPA